jgi:hypothetical protein
MYCKKSDHEIINEFKYILRTETVIATHIVAHYLACSQLLIYCKYKHIQI